jgi:predicted phage tail protein
MDKVIFLVSITLVVIIGFALFSNALRRKQQNQMHNRLLDKFTSAQDLSAFLQSSAGREYVSHLTDSLGNPAMAIISSVRSGIVLCFVGAAFFVPSVREWGAAVRATAVGVLLIFLGVGFIVSALVSFILSRRFRLITPRETDEQ